MFKLKKKKNCHYFSNKDTTHKGSILITSMKNWIILMKQRWQLLPVLIDIRVCLRIVFSNIIFFFLFCYDTCFKMDIWKWQLNWIIFLWQQIYFFLWKMNYSNFKGMRCLWIINYYVYIRIFIKVKTSWTWKWRILLIDKI